MSLLILFLYISAVLQSLAGDLMSPIEYEYEMAASATFKHHIDLTVRMSQ